MHLVEMHCRSTESVDNRGQCKLQSPAKVESRMCFSYAPGLAGVRLSEPAQAVKAGQFLHPSCGSHPLTQLKLGPDLSESQLQGKGRGRPAFLPQESAR